MLYKTAILTGMRQGELRRLQANHLRLDDESPAVYVAPAHNRKNKTGIWLPLLPRHAADGLPECPTDCADAGWAQGRDTLVEHRRAV